ncbi:MAG: hypothetical protein ABI758_02235 [Candidatus Woesebacteria bacterium]
MKKNTRSLLFAGIAVLLIAIVSIVGARYLSQSSTEDRSKATNSNTATFTTDQSETADEVTVNVYADLGQLQDTQVRQFAVSVEVATQSSVLGVSTSANRHISHSTETDQRQDEVLRTKRNPWAAFASPSPGTKVCFTDVVANGESASWTSTCKGDSTKVNCVKRSIPLTNEEQLMYQAWVDLGKSQKTQCLFVKGIAVATVTRTRPANLSASPAAVAQNLPAATATTVPTPTPAPILLTQTATLSVFKPGENLFTYTPPQVSSTTQGTTIVLSGKVENSQQQSKLTGKVLIAQIKIKKSSPAQHPVITLINQSLKGVRSIAPGVEVELLEKPTPSEIPVQR